jgi:magnesium transporter
MIEIYTLVNERVKKIKIDDIDKKKLTWIRCYKPTDESFSKLTKMVNIPAEEFKETLTEEERPRLNVTKYLELIYGAPYHGEDEVVTLPVYIYLCGNILLTIEKEPHVTFSKIVNILNRGRGKFLFKKGAGYFIFFMLDKINDLFLIYIDKIAGRIDLFEEKKYLTKKNFEDVYSLSITLSYFNQSLLANLEVLNSLRKTYFKGFTKPDRIQFSELYYDALHILDTEKIQREVITNLFNLQNIIISNRMNSLMKKLTALALIVLIPTFITGLYGMNFSYMPLAEHPHGFYIMLGLMGFLSLIAYIIFEKIDWL